MGERKVINKYYPPDFDPAKLPRKKKPKNEQIKVRMMLPMSIRCNTCGEYLYKGKKFNARKETVVGEEYLGVKIFRFYMKCTRCSAEFTIKTDPKNSDYVCESGGSRNFEPWREKEKIIEEAKQARAKEEEGDAMKALENKTMDSKIEMDIMDALDELKSLRSAQAKLDTEELLAHHKRTRDEMEKRLNEEDEELVKAVIFRNSSTYIKHIDDEDDDDDKKSLVQVLTKVEPKKEEPKPVLRPRILVAKKTVPPPSQQSSTPPASSTPTTTAPATTAPTTAPAPTPAPPKTEEPADGGALGLLAGYGDDDDDS